jgi:L-aminopeptidase/D-esterase-like protein
VAAASGGLVERGCVGAGTGATVGKVLGMEQATKSGLGTASVDAGGGVVVGAVVVATLAAAALGTRFIPFRAHGHWHTGPTIAEAALGGLALGASIYMVYLLEIVKLANPRIRRRRRERAAA